MTAEDLTVINKVVTDTETIFAALDDLLAIAQRGSLTVPARMALGQARSSLTNLRQVLVPEFQRAQREAVAAYLQRET